MSHSISIGIQVLDMIARNPGISAQEMANRVVGGWASRITDDALLKSIKRVTTDLYDMGLIKDSEGRFFAAFPPREPPSLPPEEKRPPDDDDSEGEGIRQLIDHPFLFVLSENEISERIKEALGIE